MTDYLASESDTYAHNLQVVLDVIEREGGIRAYLGNCGVGDVQIDRLQQRLSHG
jgi:hypothetical protein